MSAGQDLIDMIRGGLHRQPEIPPPRERAPRDPGGPPPVFGDKAPPPAPPPPPTPVEAILDAPPARRRQSNGWAQFLKFNKRARYSWFNDTYGYGGR